MATHCPLSILFRLYHNREFKLITKLSINEQIKLVSPELLQDDNLKQQLANQINTLCANHTEISAFNIVEQYMKDYQQTELISDLQNWSWTQLIISFYCYLISNTYASNYNHVIESNNTWLFYHYFIIHAYKHKYNGKYVYDIINQNKNDGKFIPSFAVTLIKEICKEYKQKLGTFTKIKKPLCHWINNLEQHNKIIYDHDEEKKYQIPVQLIKPKNALFHISNQTLSIVDSFNWKCNTCTYINKITMINSIWIMPSSDVHSICSFCGELKENNDDIIYTKTTEEKQNHNIACDDIITKQWHKIIGDKECIDILNESTCIKNEKCNQQQCECINRLIFIMNYYHNIIQNKIMNRLIAAQKKQETNATELVDDEKEDNMKKNKTLQYAFDKLIKYNFELLLRDYLHWKEFHNNNEMFLQKQLICNAQSVEQCLFWNRKNLKRKDFEQRKYEFVNEMYFSYNSNEIEIQRLLDIIHCDIFHFENELLIQKDSKQNVINYDEIMREINKNKDEDEECFLYLYGQYMNYKYLSPKYTTFKCELVCNERFNINENDWKRLLKKVLQMRQDAIQYNAIKNSDCNGIFDGIYFNELMGIQHFMVIYLYCSVDDLQKPLSYSYRIAVEQNKKQHLNCFYHFGRYLFCSVQYFGERMNDSSYYMQGLNRRILYKNISLLLNFPISTTHSLSVANHFSDSKGIIIYYKSKWIGHKNNTKIFDTSWISHYSQEREELLFGEWNHVLIIDIIDVQTNKSFKKQLKCIHYLNKITNGYACDNKRYNYVTNLIISKKLQITLVKMIQFELKEQIKKNIQAPKYLLDLFHFYCISRITPINLFGVKQLKLESQLKQLLNVVTLKSLFPNCVINEKQFK